MPRTKQQVPSLTPPSAVTLYPSAIAKYEIRGRLAEGGFGTVLEGWDPHIKRRVAIKVCSSEDPESRSRFQREAEIAGNLDHPNIVKIFDFGSQEGTPFLVQEFLDGKDLHTLISEEPHLSFPEKLLILLQIARGLEHAHGHGVVHRDIKPSNVRILEDGTAKLMDFGIATSLRADARITRQGMTSGTAAYLAPEQIKGDSGSTRTDIFAYGVLAYEILSGRRPFDGETISTALFQIINDNPPPLSQYWPQAPARLQQLVHRCLEKEPGDRWPDMPSLRRELETFRDGRRLTNETPDCLSPSTSIEDPSSAPGLGDIAVDFSAPPRDPSGRIHIASADPARIRRWPWIIAASVAGALALVSLAEVRGDLQLRDLVEDLRAQSPRSTSPGPAIPLPVDVPSLTTETVAVASPPAEAARPETNMLEEETSSLEDDPGTSEVEPLEPDPVPVPASLRFRRAWHPQIQVAIDGAPSRRLATAGEIQLSPGDHELRFHLATDRYHASKTISVHLDEG
ncbi:MAG: serine/threonine protein kinase, partial [Acidobacteriota bacterium]|nr:serine/threonine protein kinase [Acidobacteriota bacterium]